MLNEVHKNRLKALIDICQKIFHEYSFLNLKIYLLSRYCEKSFLSPFLHPQVLRTKTNK